VPRTALGEPDAARFSVPDGVTRMVRRGDAAMPRDKVATGRIASAEMLPSVGLLPHVICSPPGFGGGEHEADQHGDTG
jgi:hypothetical protein